MLKKKKRALLSCSALKILEFKFHTLIEIRQLGLGFCLCSVLCAKKWSLMQREIRMNILLLIHSSWQCLWKKTHQKDCVNYCAHFYRPKQASTQGKVLGNGWISNREHFLWWPLAAPSVMGLFIFNCSRVVLVWERCSRELALPVLIYAWVCTLFSSCSSQRILWAITEWLKWVQILQASARRSLLLPSFLGKSCSSRFRQCAKRGTCVNWPFHTALTILSVIIKPRERQWGGGWATD